ncbi:hypothetical protein Halru_1689 [Halovivax ruber XH-70]|uniref:NYN domain-containing protein n=1 Tax=Halovivax ruber (strain DSM 18193 / JCM 13892 / XH-70) TaxID=797302 RepID=L0I9N9_HALRX|nr:NYN domain-containing protein [Halovivax ruber]AGB16295.1 hypothetical protein Halru_1689 [Halovivax ruber XH-70]
MFESLLERVRSPPTGVALVVDGPNVFREEFDVDLDELRGLGRAEGPLVASRLYVNEHATPGLIQAAEARGFEVVVTSGDVDVRLAVDATALVTSERIGTLVVVSRDTDFKPVLERARVDGIETLAVAPGTYGRSDALQNAADRAITLDTSDETDG